MSAVRPLIAPLHTPPLLLGERALGGGDGAAAAECWTSPAVDVWALGIVVFVALVGAHPFDLDGAIEDAETFLDLRALAALRVVVVQSARSPSAPLCMNSSAAEFVDCAHLQLCVRAQSTCADCDRPEDTGGERQLREGKLTPSSDLAATATPLLLRARG